MEGGVDGLRRRRIRVWGSPGPEIHVAKHDRELTLRHREGPAVLGPTEREELALAVRAEAKPEAGVGLCRLDDLSSCGAGHRLPDRVRRLPISMQALSCHGA